ncbi:MAG TPA: hypothetical protein VNO18_25725 [Xanthobacteraceae bacterium]|jgi:hypothetical protein|nr:hypothetical protein [Xanthobacteraceae bacterium]
MEYLAGLFAVIGSFLAGILGNILANDFCEFTPRICRQFIERAVRVLPEKDRARYAEEWLSDLNDRPGVLAKFRHASSCLLNAHKVARARRRAEPPFRILRIEYKHFGSVELNYVTQMALDKCMSTSLRAFELAISARQRPPGVRIVLQTLAYAKISLNFIRAVKKYGELEDFDVSSAIRFYQLCWKSIIAHKTERTYYIDGVFAGTKD